MRLLLDTHALIWSLGESEQLTQAAAAAIDAADEVHVSAASTMEIATQFRLGKLPQAERLVSAHHHMLDAAGFQTLAITSEHALRAGSLPFPHRDPFDRLIVAQALVERMIVVSNEKLFDEFGVERIW